MTPADRLRQQAADLLALADELDGAQGARPSIDVPDQDEQWIDTGRAMKIARVSHSTVIRWCRRYRIGHRLPSGQWRVGRRALLTFLAGREDARNGENGDGEGIPVTTFVAHDRL
ncbi:helix-turn-helix domain-containing protein [Methylocystis echinoides]|uniref:Helix-turn-helix domain-containing protein n=1 Tax=Methylocystis echinoides TaxID=29468 RepID=A0A9W6GWC8_9HYPH|nr:helix-turn-helix domain-containing protein [Methylocystis echinoides]GLI94301.1 hypothetical protein LMG27198_32930 [Methylocystis echinoides]